MKLMHHEARLGAAAVLLGWLLSSGVCEGDVLINEVLYDPNGTDAGREFVELYNSGTQPVALDGYVLEAGNGDRPGDWRAQWTGGRQDVIAGHGYFLVAGDEAMVEADVRCSLALQNGPDAVRLSRNGQVLDLIGWGALLYAEFFEGEPADDVGSGWVLARVPNGADSGSNYRDCVGRPWGTAGSSNTPDFGVAILSVSLDPPIVSVGRESVLRTVVRNLGSLALDEDEIEIGLANCPLGLGRSQSANDRIAAGESIEILHSVTPELADWGGHIEVQLKCHGEGVASATLAGRVGFGQLVVSELLYDPVAGESEWIELRNLSSSEVLLGGWTVEDASCQAVTIASGAVLAAGAAGVLAQDEESFSVRWPDAAATIIPWDGRWPSLNNQVNREWGYADQVLIRDPEQIPSDYVRYCPTDFDGDGVSLERWIEGGRLISPLMLIPCSASEGATPGGSSLDAGSGMGGSHWLRPTPNPFYPDRSGDLNLCRLSIPPPQSVASQVTADVFDMAGYRVCCLGAAARHQSALILSWDGRSSAQDRLPSGIYIWRVTLRGEVPGDQRRIVCPVTLVRGQ